MLICIDPGGPVGGAVALRGHPHPAVPSTLVFFFYWLLAGVAL